MSGYMVNVDAFTTYALETAQIYVRLYNWYWMPPAVHKVLLHGGDILRRFSLPISMFSEEAQESKNKNCR